MGFIKRYTRIKNGKEEEVREHTRSNKDKTEQENLFDSVLEDFEKGKIKMLKDYSKLSVSQLTKICEHENANTQVQNVCVDLLVEWAKKNIDNKEELMKEIPALKFLQTLTNRFKLIEQFRIKDAIEDESLIKLIGQDLRPKILKEKEYEFKKENLFLELCKSMIYIPKKIMFNSFTFFMGSMHYTTTGIVNNDKTYLIIGSVFAFALIYKTLKSMREKI